MCSEHRYPHAAIYIYVIICGVLKVDLAGCLFCAVPACRYRVRAMVQCTTASSLQTGRVLQPPTTMVISSSLALVSMKK